MRITSGVDILFRGLKQKLVRVQIPNAMLR
jgi:hypothetical protein